jgi:hypothetical protein
MTTRRALELTLWTLLLGTVPGCRGFSAGCSVVAGWVAPNPRLSFPEQPAFVTDEGRFYDVDGNGAADFALLHGENGLLDVLRYDDDGDGQFDRTYRISDYDAENVPHLILLMDSIPYRSVSERYRRGEWRWFEPPRKVIAPFPSMSVVIFAEILHAPRQPGSMERYFDRTENRMVNGYRARARGYEHHWQRGLDYHLGSYVKVGLGYMNPRAWLGHEFYAAKEAFDRSDRRLTLAYLVTPSAMLSRHGVIGLEDCLDELEQMCVQLLYERRGAIKVSIISDHGHNLMHSANFLVKPVLKRAGFNVVESIEDPERDVVVEIDGLVTYFAAHTTQPVAVADLFLQQEEIQLSMYRDGDRVIVRDALGAAAIDERDGRLRYTPLKGDVLDYAVVLEQLALDGKLDEGGFVADRDWLEATFDHEWPDGPRRAWDAFDGLVESTPDVMFTLHDGHCAGDPSMEKWIEMQSTHGGFNQINTDAVLMTMIPTPNTPMRSGDVMDAIEPAFVPSRP